MITHASVSGDVVRHQDGRWGLVLFWFGEGDKREVCIAIRQTEDAPFNRAYFPMKYFMDNFSYVRKFEV